MTRIQQAEIGKEQERVSKEQDRVTCSSTAATGHSPYPECSSQPSYIHIYICIYILYLYFLSRFQNYNSLASCGDGAEHRPCRCRPETKVLPSQVWSLHTKTCHLRAKVLDTFICDYYVSMNMKLPQLQVACNFDQSGIVRDQPICARISMCMACQSILQRTV